MFRLLLKCCLILFPIGALTLALAGLSWHSGEAMPNSRIVELQQSSDGIIYGPAWSDFEMEYKVATYHVRQPDILILGSSHMLQIRAGFFTKNPAAVYNGGAGGWDLSRMVEYYGQLDSAPKIIIAQIDPSWFYDDARQLPIDSPSNPGSDDGYERVRIATIELVHRLLGGDLSLTQLIERRDPVFGGQSLGLRAIEQGGGYRADGSRQLGPLSASPAMQAEHLAASLKVTASTDGRVSTGETLYEATFATLERFLAHLRDNDITLVGVTTPPHFVKYERRQATGASSVNGRRFDTRARFVRSIRILLSFF